MQEACSLLKEAGFIVIEGIEGGSKHYKNQGEIEPLHLIEAWNLPFCAANIIKYVTRAHAPEVSAHMKAESLYKAQWYMNRLIEQLIVK